MDNDILNFESEDTDAATKAFDQLRQEIVLLRRAVTNLADEKKAIEIPNYDQTLATLAKNIDTVGRRLTDLAKKPVLDLTPEQMRRQIALAGRNARQEDAAIISEARASMDHVVADLRTAMVSAREAGEQQRMLKHSALAGVVAGIFICAILPFILASTLPDSWHLQERLAALSLGEDRSSAGGRMIASVDQSRWSDIIAADRIMSENRETIEACFDEAGENGSEVQCTVSISSTDTQSAE